MSGNGGIGRRDRECVVFAFSQAGTHSYLVLVAMLLRAACLASSSGG